jgi:hypothetical protein
MLSKELAKVAYTFLQRASLTGAEAPTMTHLLAVLEAVITAPEPAPVAEAVNAP